MTRIFIFLLFLFCCGVLPTRALHVDYADTTHCNIKSFNQKQIETYRAQRSFNYESTPAKGEGFGGMLIYLLARFFEQLENVHVGSITLYDLLFYGIAIFAAVMIVLQFFKINVSGILLKKADTVVTHLAFTEDVHDLDFDTLITNAVKSANYRLATRMYYLKALKKLSDHGLINWQKNKTNFEYYYELQGKEQRNQFYHLTRIFESVWYGNHEISESDFDENLKAFTGFLQNIRR